MRTLTLGGSAPLARGASRLVYAHPDDAALLVKVMRPDFLARRRAATRWHHRLKPARMLSIFVREIREQLILVSRGEETAGFLQRITGFCDTDLGPGMLVCAVRDPAGAFAPSLAHVVAAGRFDAQARRDLDRFCEHILASDITLGALAARNILYGADAGGGRRFVLIDGYGEGALLPLRGSFPTLNRALKRRHVRGLRRAVARLQQRHAGAAATAGLTAP